MTLHLISPEAYASIPNKKGRVNKSRSFFRWTITRLESRYTSTVGSSSRYAIMDVSPKVPIVGGISMLKQNIINDLNSGALVSGYFFTESDKFHIENLRNCDDFLECIVVNGKWVSNGFQLYSDYGDTYVELLSGYAELT